MRRYMSKICQLTILFVLPITKLFVGEQFQLIQKK